MRYKRSERIVFMLFRHLNLGTKTIHPVKYNILFSPNQA